MKKKILSILLMMAMIVSMFPASAFAVTVDKSYMPGTYTGEAIGYDNGKVTVTVKLEADSEGNTVISDIEADGSTQTQSVWEKAKAVLSQIKEKNGTDDIDTVSGATNSVNAIKEATEKALAKAASTLSGSGTEKDPYVIANAGQLAAFAAAVDGGESYDGKYVALGDDIDLSDVSSWNPIGDESGIVNIFNGTFDGKGHTISKLKIDANVTEGESNYGLFSTLGNKAVVKSLNITDAAIAVENTGTYGTSTEKVRAGIIAGETVKAATSAHNSIGTRIDSCSATGSVSAVSTKDKMTFAGGIVGMGDIGTAITNCWTDASVRAVANPVSNKNSMAGGIIGSSGNYVVIANCATFGDVYAASPSSTNFGGMAGGIVGMMAGKQYNVYATGNITIGNGGITKHSWVGVLDGQVTSSGMTKDSSGDFTIYPEQGVFRLGGYYAGDAVLKVEMYKNSGADLDTETTLETVADRGSSSTLGSLDKAMISTVKTKAEMAEAAFAETLNGNIKDINKILAAYEIAGISLREWKLSGNRVLPTGNVWVSGEIDASIFESGEGTESSPYIIKTEDQLRAFAGSLNDKIDYTDKFVALGDDIKLSDEEWKPVGRSDYLFNGTFDGQGHTVSGMTLGSAEKPFALDKENLYIGFFGVLGPQSVVKNLKLTDVAFHTTFEATAYVGGIAGVTQGSRTNNNFTGAVIDGCSVEGSLSLTGNKGNQFVGGLVGMQYKGAIINSVAKVNASGVVLAGDLAEVGGLVGLNNRGLVANCRSDSTIHGSGSRENGNEGMAVASNLVACNAGMLVNCYGSGNVTTKEHSVYAGMVSGWVTGIGKSYNCWYNLDSTMIVGAETDNPLTVNPVESIGTKVASGVNDEGDAYTGGLVDRMTGYNSESYSALAGELNNTFAAFPADITVYGLKANALKNWAYTDGTVTFGDTNAAVNYVQPDCEKVEKPELKLNDGTWYGRDNDKKSVVKITVKDGEVATEAISGAESGESFDAALEKAKYKATYGDFSHYEKADPGKFAGGSGTAEDPYRISNEAQLRYLSYSINADVNWSDTYFVQTADITLTGGDWQPIGWALNGEVNGKKTQVCAYPFKGNFDGGNYTIRGLAIGTETNPADQMTSGLFGLTAGTLNTNEKITESDKVVRLSNIHLENIYINAATRYETYTGGLVGSGQTGIFIDNCSVTGKINATTSESFARAGGLGASVLRGAVTNSRADVDINAVTDTNHVYAGGLYGMDNRVTTINCYALGNVKGNSTNNNKVHIGGLAGQAGGIHINCYATGDVVSLKTTTDVGILNGRSGGITIDYNCYYNSEAVLKQGDTVVSPVKGIGVITTNATAVNVEGKAKAEMSGSEFAALLNSSITDSSMKKIFAAVDEALTAQAGRDFVQQNYYEGNKLSGWTVKNGTVTFGENQSQPSQPSVPAVPPASEVQKPEIAPVTGGDVKLSEDGTSIEITPAAGMVIEKVTVNGKEVAVKDNKVTGLKTGDKVVVTFVKKSQTGEEEFNNIKDGIKNLKLAVSTSKNSKKNVKVNVKIKNGKSLIKDLESKGYTVKYKFYKSTKKDSKYKAVKTKNAGSYINTSGKKGTKYYYKAKVLVYDGKTLAAQTELKQCSYGVRTWSK